MNRTKIFAAVTAASLTSAALYAAPGVMRDADGNGTVTKAEVLAAADARFAKMDANADGTLNEADKAAKVAKRFATIDADTNGSLSQAEFVAAHEARADKRENRREKRMGRGGAEGKMGRHGGRGHGGGMKMLAACRYQWRQGGLESRIPRRCRSPLRQGRRQQRRNNFG